MTGHSEMTVLFVILPAFFEDKKVETVGGSGGGFQGCFTLRVSLFKIFFLLVSICFNCDSFIGNYHPRNVFLICLLF